MNNLLLYFIVIVAGLILTLRFKRVRKTRFKIKKRVSNIAKWMEMTREERHAWDEQDKKISIGRKRTLLNQIRKEYLELSDQKNRVK